MLNLNRSQKSYLSKGGSRDSPRIPPLATSLAVNNQFANVGPKLAKSIEIRQDDDQLLHLINRVDETVFQFKYVSESTVSDNNQKLKQGKATGPDKIATGILKDAVHLVSKRLKMIFNSSPRHEILPGKLESSTSDTNL